MTYSDEFLEFLQQFKDYCIRGGDYSPEWASGHECGVCPNDKCLGSDCSDARGHNEAICTQNPDGYCVINIQGYACVFFVEDILEGNVYADGYITEDGPFVIVDVSGFEEFGVVEGDYAKIKKVIYRQE